MSWYLTTESSCGALEVEQWSDNRTLPISVDHCPLVECMIIWYNWTRYVMYVLGVCKLKDYIIYKEIEERLYEHYSRTRTKNTHKTNIIHNM